MITLGKKIKEMRMSKELSQAEVAELLGFSRTLYNAIEQEKRDLSFQEAEKISQIFGVTVEELHTGMIPNYPKYRQMLLQFLRFVDKDGKIPKTKLAKYLYLADFAWFYKTLDSMSGMSYRKIEHGPVPDSYFRAIEELESEGLVSVAQKKHSTGNPMYLISSTRAGKKADLDLLDKKEVSLMKKIEKKWRNASTQEIVAFTHSQIPFEAAFEGEVISYSVITQEDPDYVI